MFGKRGEKHPRFGQARPEGAGKPSQKVELVNILTNEKKIYQSINEASNSLGCSKPTIRNYIKHAKPFKGIYEFRKI